MKAEGTVKRCFELNLIIMRLLGFYPPRQPSKFYKLYALFVYASMTIPVPVLAALYLILGENIDSNQIGDNSFIMFELGSFISKLVPFIFNPMAIRKTLYMTEWKIFSIYDENQEELMKRCEKQCKRNTHIFFGLAVVTLVSWAVAPFFRIDQRFPTEIWLPFACNSFRFYVATYIFIVVGVGNGGIANGAIDPLISGLLYFAVIQLRVLKHNLTHLSENADKETTTSLSESEKRILKNKIIYRKIQDCITHHKAVLRFVQYYENVYSPVIFTQFMAAGLVICVSCWQLSMVEPFTFPFFAMVTFLLTMLFQIILYCYIGAILIEESANLTTAAYMGPWYEYSLKCQKALIILMERSKRPMVVTVGKLMDLSLVTFTTILRRAYSLLAVLKNY